MVPPVLPVLELAFDPAVHLGDFVVRWQAVVIAVGVLLALLAAAAVTRVEATLDARSDPLRLDDLLYVTLGILPGAVVGARLFHALGYLDVYGGQPDVLLDVTRGGFSLTGGVLGGAVTGLYIASLLEGTARRWADTAAGPMLIALGIGKVGQFLGGGGQGAFWDGPWAVSFTGQATWSSPAAAVPAHPVAVYEAAWYLAGILAVAWGAGRLRGTREGASFLVAICWFLAGRALLGFFWRDDRLVGPFNVEQTLALLSLGGIVVVTSQVVVRRRPRQRALEKAGFVPPRGD